MTEASLSERILEIFDDLTRNERHLADLILGQPDMVVLSTAAEISEKAKVSKATTARFFKRLGYPSFRTAQKLARTGEAGDRGGKRLFSAPMEKISGRSELADHLANDVQNLIKSIEAIRSDDMKEAVAFLARAEKIWVIGFGESYPLAHFARAQLIKVKSDIRMIPIGGFSVPEEFASIASADAVIALGIGRKLRSLNAIINSATLAGAKVIYITDQISEGPNSTSCVMLRCRTQGISLFDSVAAPVSLLTYLCVGVANRLGHSAVDRIRYIESIHDEWGGTLSGGF